MIGLLRSFRFRITLWYGIALALVMLAFGSLMYGMVRLRLRNHYDRMLAEQSVQVGMVLREEEDCGVLTQAQIETLDRLGPIILLHELNGRQEVYYASPQMRANPLAPAVGSLGLGASTVPLYLTLHHRGVSWRILAQPYQAHSGRHGTILLMAKLDEIQETLAHIRITMLLLIPAGILGSALSGFWLAGRALAPVDRITRRANEIEASRLDQRLPHPGVTDEIGRLVDTLNRMIARLETSFQAMQRFTADASHELRNPLATMQNTIDVVLAQPRSPEQQRAALESLGEDVERLRRIVEDLLLLARADNGRLLLKREPVRLDELVPGLGETCQARAAELGVALEVDVPGPALVIGDEPWLYQLVGNLVDNALKFTPPGGRVRLTLRTGSGRVRLQVRDSGPGLPEGSFERVFERFFQADPSRARGASPGSGLGLAIAAWIAEAHGGRIQAANHPAGGAVFTVDLPEAPGPGPAAPVKA